MTKTCTVHTAVGGECAAPAVTTFKNSRGQEFHECVEHAPYGAHLLTCDKPLPLCQICGPEFGLSPTMTTHCDGGPL